MKLVLVREALLLTALIALGATACAQKTVFSNATPSALQNEEDDLSAVNQMPAKEEEAEQDPFDEDWEFDEFEDEMEEEAMEVADPIIYWNKAMYHFNDKLYFWVMKPVAKGYKWAVPEPARRGIDNFFHNLAFPVRLVGCLLQAKGREALGECGRFGMNTTIGILGFGNPARKHPYLNPSEEDVGQAFGRWGIGNGMYIVWPLFGPSTLRDSAGSVGHYFLDPFTYISNRTIPWGIYAIEAVNSTSLHIGDYEALKNAAIDPYIAIRDAYIQNRQEKVED